MQIVILNGGKGTRVSAISKNNPKCMISFNGKPFINHQIKLLKKMGFKKIFFCLGYKSNIITKYLSSLNFNGIKIEYSIEKKPLGTGGTVVNSLNKLDKTFFLTYGDSYLKIDYKKILKKFQTYKKSCLMTVVHKKKVADHKPNIVIKKNAIKSYGYSINSNYIDYGALIFKKKIFKEIKIKKFDLANIIADQIEKNDIISYKINKKFLQIGSIKGIREFKKSINNLK